MKECDLYPPVKRWLDSHGYQVHVEIFGCDIVALKDGRILVVELKIGRPTAVEKQAVDRARWADEVIVALPNRPRRTDGLRYRGFGLMVVSGDKVRLVIRPRQQPWFREKQRRYRFGVLAHHPPARDDEVAGLPCCSRLAEQRRTR